MVVSGLGGDGEIRIVELPGHPFFLATLFLPQTGSAPGFPTLSSQGSRPGFGGPPPDISNRRVPLTQPASPSPA